MRLGGWEGWRGVQLRRNYKMKRRQGMRGFRLLKLQQIYLGVLEDLRSPGGREKGIREGVMQVHHERSLDGFLARFIFSGVLYTT